MKRRDFLTTSALAAAGASLGLQVAPVSAKTGLVAGIAAAQSFKIGSVKVTAFSDGFLPIPAEFLIGVTPEDYAALLKAAYIKEAAHPSGLNTYVIEVGDRKILVDAGAGTALGPTTGHMAENMHALGMDPASITEIFATHLHVDHIGGLGAVETNPFPNAQLTVAASDIEFWTSDANRAQAPNDMFRSMFDLAKGVTTAYKDNTKSFTGETDLGNGLHTVPLPGHTVGHTGLLLESDGDQLLIWGDILHVPAVQLVRPEVTIGFDTDQELARATRKTTLDRTATDRLRVAGMHIGFPGMGYVEKASEGYHFVPQPYPYG